jgi:hypothetical protein
VGKSHHFDVNVNLCAKDIIRQKKIEDFLKCKFIRLKLDTKWEME